MNMYMLLYSGSGYRPQVYSKVKSFGRHTILDDFEALAGNVIHVVPLGDR